MPSWPVMQNPERYHRGRSPVPTPTERTHVQTLIHNMRVKLSTPPQPVQPPKPRGKALGYYRRNQCNSSTPSPAKADASTTSPET